MVKLMPAEFWLFPRWHELFYYIPWMSAHGRSHSWIFSQNHRIVGVGRDLCGSPSPTLLLKQGHLSSGLGAQKGWNPTLPPHSACRQKILMGWSKHALREGAAASSLKADGGLGAHTWPTGKDAGCPCLSCLWCRPSGAKSAWGEIKLTDMCLGYLPNSCRAAGGWCCGFNLNILCSDVVDQKRELGWLVAGGKPCLLTSILRRWQQCQCQVRSPGGTACSQRDCAVPGRSNATPRLGPLDIVVLQINNRVRAADIACNVVSQFFQRAQCLMCWTVGKTGPVFRCLLECWTPKKFWYPAEGAAFPWVPWLMSSAQAWAKPPWPCAVSLGMAPQLWVGSHTPSTSSWMTSSQPRSSRGRPLQLYGALPRGDEAIPANLGRARHHQWCI